MDSTYELATIGLRVVFNNIQITEEIGKIIRTVHRQSVTIESDHAFVAYVVGGAATVAAVGFAGYSLKKYFGDRGRPLAPNCIIYEVIVPKSEKKRLEEYVSSGSLKRDLQRSFETVEDELRKVLGEEYSKVDSKVVESLKKTDIASVELCNQQELQKAWKKFWEMQETKATETEISVTLNEKIKTTFGGKISESKLKIIIQGFKDLGVDSPEDVALLTTNDIAKQVESALTLVELRKLMEFVKGHEMPLPPSSIWLSSAEYPNSALTVFFDDPNKTACEYMVTARDVMSAEEMSVKSDANFGVLKNLRPGRRYVIYAQCISNNVKSKKSFFREPINVFEGMNEADASAQAAGTDLIKPIKDVKSVPTITDSAYQSEFSRTTSDRDHEDGASVLAKSEIQLGEEAGTSREQAEGLQPLWESRIHDEFKSVFPGMTPTRMKDLLRKCGDIGIQEVDDLQYLEEMDAEELKGTLKTIELRKLLKHVKGGKNKKPSGGITIGDSGRDIGNQSRPYQRFIRGHLYPKITPEIMLRN